MKANELMLADWVNITKEGLAQVVMVDQYHIVTTRAKHLVDERKLEPIPITAEILKANGFENYKDIGSLSYYKNTDKLLKFEFYGKTLEDYSGSRIIEIGCVHEFQHALRLMGLNDMADNFKIGEGGEQ